MIPPKIWQKGVVRPSPKVQRSAKFTFIFRQETHGNESGVFLPRPLFDFHPFQLLLLVTKCFQPPVL